MPTRKLRTRDNFKAVTAHDVADHNPVAAANRERALRQELLVRDAAYKSLAVSYAKLADGQIEIAKQNKLLHDLVGNVVVVQREIVTQVADHERRIAALEKPRKRAKRRR